MKVQLEGVLRRMTSLHYLSLCLASDFLPFLVLLVSFMFSCFGTSTFFSMFPLFSLLVSPPCLPLLVLPSSSLVLLVFLPHSSLLELLVSFHCFHFLFIASFPCLTLLVLLVSLLFSIPCLQKCLSSYRSLLVLLK